MERLVFDENVTCLQELNRGVSDDFLEETGYKPANEPLHRTGHLAGPISVTPVRQGEFDYDYSEAKRLPIGAKVLPGTVELDEGTACPAAGRRRPVAKRRGRNKNGLVDRRTLSARGKRIADRRPPDIFPYAEREPDN